LLTHFFTACKENQTKGPNVNMNRFEAFKMKEKFAEDKALFYTGLADSSLRPTLTEKINLAADDFKILAESGKANDKEYQDKIEKGLKRFSNIYIDLDTEDRERICHYYEELMDIVGLESSDGHLNNFMYGFDPTAK
jgi:hypothetical protein